MSHAKHIDKAQEFFTLLKQGMNYTDIGKKYGISRDDVGLALRASRLVKPRDRLSNIKKILELYIDGYSKHEIAEKLSVGYSHVTTTIKRQNVESLIKPPVELGVKANGSIYAKPSWSPSAVASKALGTLQLSGHRVSIDAKQSCFYVDGVRKDTVQLLDMVKGDHKPIKPVASHLEFKNHKPKKVNWNV